MTRSPQASTAAGAAGRSRALVPVALTVALLGIACASHVVCANIIGEDDRVRIEQRGAPWDAIGQVNVGGYSRREECTGTLVAPDIVITAAHCVVDVWKAAPVPLRDIHFLAGVRPGGYLAHATAKCLHFLPGYRLPEKALSKDAAETFASEQQEGTDVAAIVLNQKLDIAPVAIAKRGIFAPGQKLVNAGYPVDRRYILSADMACRLLGVERDPALWRHDCDTQQASSGGPVLVTVDGELQLAAVNIGSGEDYNIAVPIAGRSDFARDGKCTSEH